MDDSRFVDVYRPLRWISYVLVAGVIAVKAGLVSNHRAYVRCENPNTGGDDCAYLWTSGVAMGVIACVGAVGVCVLIEVAVVLLRSRRSETSS